MSAEKKPLVCPSISTVGVRCKIDLTFLSCCWKVENNPADINKLFNFSDFNDRHWCSCRLSCAWWPKRTQILKQKKSQNHRVAQIGRLDTAMQTEMHNFGTTLPKMLDNWDDRPTACKLNVTLLLSADSSEKKNTPSVVSDRTQLNVLHYSTFSRDNHLLLHLLASWVTMESMCREERRGTALQSDPAPLLQRCNVVAEQISMFSILFSPLLVFTASLAQTENRTLCQTKLGD